MARIQARIAQIQGQDPAAIKAAAPAATKAPAAPAATKAAATKAAATKAAATKAAATKAAATKAPAAPAAPAATKAAATKAAATKAPAAPAPAATKAPAAPAPVATKAATQKEPPPTKAVVQSEIDMVVKSMEKNDPKTLAQLKQAAESDPAQVQAIMTNFMKSPQGQQTAAAVQNDIAKTAPAGGKPSMFGRLTNWVKNNKLKSAAIGLGALLTIGTVATLGPAALTPMLITSLAKAKIPTAIAGAVATAKAGVQMKKDYDAAKQAGQKYDWKSGVKKAAKDVGKTALKTGLVAVGAGMAGQMVGGLASHFGNHGGNHGGTTPGAAAGNHGGTTPGAADGHGTTRSGAIGSRPRVADDLGGDTSNKIGRAHV